MYPKIIRSVNWSTNITLQKWRLASLDFYGTWWDCKPLDLTDYSVSFTIYAKNSNHKLWLPQTIETVADPTKWKVTFIMTTNDDLDNYCWLEDGCCYKYDVVASKKVAPFWDAITLWCGNICLEKCFISK
jgi:hypothetical protein